MGSLRRQVWSDQPPWPAVRYGVAPAVIRGLHCGLMSSLRISTSGLWRSRDYLEQRVATGAIFICWHHDLLFPLHLFRNRGLSAMLSTSREGRITAALWQMYGWKVIWGSTGKLHSVASLRQGQRLLRRGHSLALAPDGPLGPRHQAHAGVAYLAAQTGAPVMALGVATAAAWRLPTWDGFLVPKPFARCHVHLGLPLTLPRNLSRGDIACWQQRIGDATDQANAVAWRRLTSPTSS